MLAQRDLAEIVCVFSVFTVAIILTDCAVIMLAIPRRIFDFLFSLS